MNSLLMILMTGVGRIILSNVSFDAMLETMELISFSAGFANGRSSIWLDFSSIIMLSFMLINSWKLNSHYTKRHQGENLFSKPICPSLLPFNGLVETKFICKVFSLQPCQATTIQVAEREKDEGIVEFSVWLKAKRV